MRVHHPVIGMPVIEMIVAKCRIRCGGIVFSCIRAVNGIMASLQFKSLKPDSRGRTWWVLSLVMIALIMAGFAHRAMPVDAERDLPAEARYVLPDGTVLDVCINGDSDHADHGGACEFCRIASASHSLDGLPVLEPIRFNPITTMLRHDEAVPVLLTSYGNPVRAPPSV